MAPAQDEFKPSACRNHPGKPARSLRIARRVDHTQRGPADGLHSGEFEDAEFKPAYAGAQLHQLSRPKRGCSVSRLV